MVKESYPYLIFGGVGASVAFMCGVEWAAVALLFLTAFTGFFFRNPDRIIPSGEDQIVSPADGRIVDVREVESGTRLSIFLSIFDVHISRSPISGRIVSQTYHPGKFHFAFDDRASIENERMDWTLEGEIFLKFSLIAGLIARRIVAWKREGEKVSCGDRIGLIKFGSRVDITLPKGSRLVVSSGERVRGGETVLARLGEPV